MESAPLARRPTQVSTTYKHRGRMDDPLYMARRLLTLAAERLGDKSENKLMGLLRAGEPKDTLALAATQIRSNS